MLPGPLITALELARVQSRVRLLDVRSGEAGAQAYAQRHLTGALRADMEQDLAAPGAHPEVGGRHPLPDLAAWAQTLGDWGIDPETPVVVYDDQDGAAAARAWWMLVAVDHPEVALLDGGLKAALEVGLSTDGNPPEIESRSPYPLRRWNRPTATLQEVDQRRQDPSWRVLDVRSRERYRGESEPLDPVAGHIPGALNLPYPENLGPDGRFLPAETLATLYRDLLGEVAPERVIVHCGSGVTACHTLLALERAGWSQATSLYVGSWSEWCVSSRPREP